MTLSPLDDPALTVALALAAGMLGQSLARHLRIPGIVVLLAGGVLLGPDVLGLVRPRTLGPALASLVGFAVAVVLFEGGMNLDLKRLRREARSIRQMVTVGSVVTALGGAATARLLLGWSPKLSLLFGTLVIVTGPTVITPLLRRIRVQANVSTVLEAEAVFGDAIGALIAVVALEVALAPSGSLLVAGAWGLASRLSVGLVAGVIGGWVIGALLRSGWVPEGLENVFTLALVLALYQATNALQPESGIVAVILAGLIVGNLHAPALSALKDFKEQLTILFIGMLFVLLAADVRLSEVVHLGWPGVATVLALMFVVRPANVLAGTWGAGLGWREKAFMTWMSPRGIVAAAVSSHFATALTAAGLPGGSDLRALVFLVIAVTVVVQGLSGGAVAGLLRLRREITGFAILGANGLGRAYGELLREAGQEAIFLDSNLDACRAARAAGFRALHGSALAEDRPRPRRARRPRRLPRAHRQRGGQLPLRPHRPPRLEGREGLGGGPPRPRGGAPRDGPGARRPRPLRRAAEPELLGPAPGTAGGRGGALAAVHAGFGNAGVAGGHPRGAAGKRRGRRGGRGPAPPPRSPPWSRASPLRRDDTAAAGRRAGGGDRRNAAGGGPCPAPRRGLGAHDRHGPGLGACAVGKDWPDSTPLLSSPHPHPGGRDPGRSTALNPPGYAASGLPGRNFLAEGEALDGLAPNLSTQEARSGMSSSPRAASTEGSSPLGGVVGGDGGRLGGGWPPVRPFPAAGSQGRLRVPSAFSSCPSRWESGSSSSNAP